jgi:hypothetical protein
LISIISNTQDKQNVLKHFCLIVGRLVFDSLTLEASATLQQEASFLLRCDQLLMHYDSLVSSDIIDIVVSLATVEGGASLDVTGRGHAKNTGPGAGNSTLGSGGHHGGYGGRVLDLLYANGK